MTSLSTIRLDLLHPVYSLNPHGASSSTSPPSHNSDTDDDEDESDHSDHERYDPNGSDITLRIQHTNSSTTTIVPPHRVTYQGSELRQPGQALLTPVDTREFYRGQDQSRITTHHTSKSTRPPSAVGIDHALKLSFLSTLGPGIPVTPTASVFGDGLNGFVSRNPSNPGGIFGYTPEEEKRLVRKIDWRIIPILGMFYALSTINRVNMLNARLYAFESTLNITQEQYSWVIALFFVGYGIAEIPSNLALLYLTPKVWLPASMFIWGCISLSLGFAKNYHMIYVGRFFLGVSEAALIPGVLIYVSMFYKRSEQTFRMAILQVFSTAAGGLGGLISRGMDHLDGVLNLHGWQWIFVAESVVTMILAISAWFLLTKSPESAPWLNQRETSIAVYRIRNDTKIKVTRRISLQNIVAAIKDRKVYIFMAMNFCISIALVTSNGLNSRAWMGLAKAIKDGNKLQDINIVNSTVPMDAAEAVAPLTMPLALVQGYMASVPFGVPLVQEPTHGARQLAQLISSPNYVVGAISSFSVALIADRTQQRGIITMVLTSIMILSYCLALLTLKVYVNYAAVLILSMAQTPLTPVVTSWLTTNLGGYAKRAIAVAMFLLSSSMGSVIGSQVFKPRDGPQYTKGHLVNISCITMVMCLAMIQRFMLKRENNRRNYSVSFGVNPLKSFTKAELRDLNDGHPAFRYTL